MPKLRWSSSDMGCQAMVDWIEEHYRKSEKSRLCFAIQGASAVGKTTLAFQIRSKLIEKAEISSWMVRRDLFIIKGPERRSFDFEATTVMQGQLQDWQLHNKKADELLGCPLNLPRALEGNGIVLLDDMRNMPKLSIDGSIYLFRNVCELTRQEEARNGVSWPWWEHLRRRCSKFLLQRKLIGCAARSKIPSLVVHWNPYGESTAWKLNE